MLVARDPDINHGGALGGLSDVDIHGLQPLGLKKNPNHSNAF